MSVADLLLALVGCRRTHGPPPPIGTLHAARTNWRGECSHCWLYAIFGYLAWAVTIWLMVFLVQQS